MEVLKKGGRVSKPVSKQMNDPEPFLSESQERLVALLKKSFDVVPFAVDEECNEMFARLAKFCQKALEKRNRGRDPKYANMDIESLIGLSRSIEEGTAATQATSTSPAPASTQATMPTTNGSKRPRGSQESDRSEAEPAEESERWTFEKAYNVVEVTEVQLLGPRHVILRVLARPPVAGNKAPREYCMETADLQAVDGFRGKPGKRLRDNLASSLEKYYQVNDSVDPAPLIDLLRPFLWAAAFIEAFGSKRRAQ